jgi:hypothetical protein
LWPWIVGVSCSLIAAVIAFTVRGTFDAWRSRKNARSGQLAGEWYQITYDPNDWSKLWSIEWLNVSHHYDTIEGTMWRVWRHPCAQPHFDRQWKFLAHFRNGFLVGHYWSESGDGGDGSLHLRHPRRSYCQGKFQEELPTGDPGAFNVNFEAPLDWIRVGSDNEPRVLNYFDQARRTNRMVDTKIRRRVEERMRHLRQGIEDRRPLSYGCVLKDDISQSVSGADQDHPGGRGVA